MSATQPYTRADKLLGAVMTALLLVGFWQGMAALFSPEALLRLKPALNPSAILAGHTAATINYIMSHNLPADPLLRAAGGILRWRLFHSGGPQVGVGCNNWLYLTEELRPWPGAEAAMRQRADLVRRVADKLESQAIRLRIVVVPDKARVENGTLCGLRYAAQARERYAAFAALLHARGIVQVDLLQPFLAVHGRQPLYYRTDTHWNQDGAKLAAHLVAEVARIKSGDVIFRTEAADVPVERVGDLLRLMSLDKVTDWGDLGLRPAPDVEFMERTVPVEASAARGLLDEEPAAEVVLIGSSFSENANFHGRLQQELGIRISRFARPGGGFAGAAREYLSSIAFRETPPKLVIWEFPERTLGQLLGNDEAKLFAETLPGHSAIFDSPVQN